LFIKCILLPHLLFWQGEVRERGQPMDRERRHRRRGGNLCAMRERRHRRRGGNLCAMEN